MLFLPLVFWTLSFIFFYFLLSIYHTAHLSQVYFSLLGSFLHHFFLRLFKVLLRFGSFIAYCCLHSNVDIHAQLGCNILYFESVPLVNYTSLLYQLTITLTKEEGHTEVQHNEYCYAGGLVEYVKWLNTDKVCSNTVSILSID